MIIKVFIDVYVSIILALSIIGHHLLLFVEKLSAATIFWRVSGNI